MKIEFSKNITANKLPWLDLSIYNVGLYGVILPDNTKKLALIGLDPGCVVWDKALAELDFKESKTGTILLSDELNVDIPGFRAIFPLMKVRELERHKIFHKITSPSPNKDVVHTDEINIHSASLLGLNSLDFEVYVGENGRFYRDTIKKETILESTNADIPKGLFLKAETNRDLKLCATGLINTALSGVSIKKGQLNNFIDIIFQGKASPKLAIKTQELVEGGVNKFVTDNYHTVNKVVYDQVLTLISRLPKNTFKSSESITLQQYSTPAPLSLACQMMLSSLENCNILEPTIGNCSTVTILGKQNTISGVELSVGRAMQTKANFPNINTNIGDATDFDFKELIGDKEFDGVICNPPFGGLKPPRKFKGLNCTRLDHLILLESLEARRDKGLAVYIIGADRDNMFPGKEGHISGGSKNLFNWLTDHYEVVEPFEIKGSLYAGMGANYPIRVVPVARRYSPDEVTKFMESKEKRIPNLKLPVIDDWDELFNQASKVKSIFSTMIPPIKDEIVVIESPSVKKYREIEDPTPTFNEFEGLAKATTVKTKTEEPSEKKVILTANDFQTAYETLSSTPPKAMIPKNLARASNKALGNLKGWIGTKTVEEFIVSVIPLQGFDVDHVKSVFNAEQRDALALCLYTFNNGRAFIEADQTGLGKGRVIAGIALWAILREVPVVFLTEKPTLFTDIWRDLVDVTEGVIDPRKIVRPFILNRIKSTIKDQKNNIVFKRSTDAEIDAVLKTPLGKHPLTHNGYNLMCATYSQFNREPSKTERSQMLPLICEGACFLQDESHNSAGDSNTALNISTAEEHASHIKYASATFAKTAKNIEKYRHVFPEGRCNSKLAETLQIGGEPLLEILSAMLVEDGCLVRRERDLSGLIFRETTDTENNQHNRDLSDKLASILLQLASISGDVQGIVKETNKQFEKDYEALPNDVKKGNRMNVSSQNFGSRLYQIMRQFIMVIKIPHTIGKVTESLKEGRKPIIVMENTFESMLKDVLFEEGDSSKSNVLGDEVAIPSFRDLLQKTLDKLHTIVERNDYGDVAKVSVFSLLKTDSELKAWAKLTEGLQKEISHFPDLPIFPIDQLRMEVENQGYRQGEVSGRSIQIDSIDWDRGVCTIGPRVDERANAIFDFNNGGVDVLIATRAGCAGLSVHASSKFLDKRQREMFELQISNDVNSRIQFFGRANREGQVCFPIITTISSGLPSEIRVLAMQNAKLRKLSANTSSSRRNSAEIDVPDLLNVIGDRLCLDFLFHHPHIADDLGIDLPETPGDMKSKDYYVNKLTGRICLLLTAEQESIYEQLNTSFDIKIAELEDSGHNPLKEKVHDVKANIVNESVYDGVEVDRYVSSFDKPVYVADIEWEEDIQPLSGNEVLDRLDDGVRAFNNDPRIERGGLLDIVDENCHNIARRLFTSTSSLKNRYKNYVEASQDSKENSVKSLFEKNDWCVATLKYLKPGVCVSFNAKDSEDRVEGVVTRLDLPPSGNEHFLGHYSVEIAVAGDDNYLKKTFNMLRKGKMQRIPFLSVNRDMKLAFDDAPKGKQKFRRTILRGNMFRASEIASQRKMGWASTFSDETGAFHRGIILGREFTQRTLALMPPIITDVNIVMELLKNHSTLELCSEDKSQGGNSKQYLRAITIKGGGENRLNISMYGVKKYSGQFSTDEKLIALTNDGFYGSSAQLEAEVTGQSAIKELLVYLMNRQGVSFYAPVAYSDEIKDLQRIELDNKVKNMNVVHTKPTQRMSAGG